MLIHQTRPLKRYPLKRRIPIEIGRQLGNGPKDRDNDTGANKTRFRKNPRRFLKTLPRQTSSLEPYPLNYPIP